LTDSANRSPVVLRPSSGIRLPDARELLDFRDLLRILILRDLKLRYRQTVLGVGWVILQPLLAALVLSFVFARVASLPTEGTPPLLFSLAGVVGFGLFANTLTRVSASLLQNSALVTKVFFPRLLLPLAAAGGALVDFVISLGILAFFMWRYGHGPGLSLVLLPVWSALLLVLGLGLGLMAAVLSVRYRDVQHMLPLLLQVALYASPVAYAVTAVPPQSRRLYLLNPLAPIIDSFRSNLIGLPMAAPAAALWAAGICVACLLSGVLLFRALERRLADVI
jgi:lipopolysaccharide transport system permease protein